MAVHVTGPPSCLVRTGGYMVVIWVVIWPWRDAAMQKRTRNPVLLQLQAEWRAFTRTSAAAEALRSWCEREPTFRTLAAMTDLADAVRRDTGGTTSVTASLLRLADHDAVARRALLDVMHPAMAGRVRWLQNRIEASGLSFDAEDAGQTVVAAMVEVIATNRGRSLAWPVSHLRSGLRKALFAPASSEEERARRESPLEIDVADGAAITAEHELLDLLGRAADRGVLSATDCALVWMTRVGGWDTSELTQRFGASHHTLLKRRYRAEQALARAA